TPRPLVSSYTTNTVGACASGRTDFPAVSRNTSPFGNPSVIYGDTPLSLAAIEDPATTIMATDFKGTTVSNIYDCDQTDLSNTGASKVDLRHLDGANFLFGDGHVKW